jgi:hypothetical protein
VFFEGLAADFQVGLVVLGLDAILFRVGRSDVRPIAADAEPFGGGQGELIGGVGRVVGVVVGE